MILPLLLIVLAIVAAAAVAYGTDPGWVEFQHGLQLILWSRRLHWPLVAVALVACVGLIALAISGRRRAWWLIGLGPVLVLFVHSFRADRARPFAVLDNPQFTDAADATGVADDNWVVGLSFGGTAYAYPYAALFRAPVVVQADHDRHMVLLWSAYANRVLAFQATGDLRARDLEVVSTPANAPLVFNSRVGQFVNGLTGQTPDGQKPAGFGNPIGAGKTTWRQWRQAHPAGKVLKVAAAGTGTVRGPTGPIVPTFKAFGLSAAMGPGDSAVARDSRLAQPASSARVRVVVVGTTQPVAVDADAIGPTPINLHADGEPVLLFRPAPGEPVRAFSRRFGDDIRSRFEARRDPKHPDVRFKDVDTGTLWDANGVAVAGNKQFHGKRLTPVPVDDGVDWAVLKYWYPRLELEQTSEPPVTIETEPAEPEATKAAGPRKAPRRRAPRR